jgi:hypothetical protein
MGDPRRERVDIRRRNEAEAFEQLRDELALEIVIPPSVLLEVMRTLLLFVRERIHNPPQPQICRDWDRVVHGFCT